MKRILVVEDEVSISHLISYNLEQAGYRVETAADGVEALRQLDGFCPHLVTLDLLLPQRSGWEVLHCLRHHPQKRVASLPVIVVSALNSLPLRAELRQNGVRYCLDKPFSVAELCRLVHTLLEEHIDSALASPL